LIINLSLLHLFIIYLIDIYDNKQSINFPKDTNYSIIYCQEKVKIVNGNQNRYIHNSLILLRRKRFQGIITGCD